ncbi:hypothetical protein Bhyg_11859 [Pseudolycoriella hygida]|uniref:Uncharacterized protein n=1 Tax=Pseudolycoriella hygida TaxID=35572 RepID=A0A9Q0RYR6_9DIPT|nr:hypothetical protein Bhyg_11859 [Pseudolycoriella hygida]
MEPNDVLKRYLDVCSNKDDKCMRYSFASNGVLEWFGRNIKDNNKIFEYIRYNISLQYEQIFSVAIKCEAFEVKPLHKDTMNQPSDTIANYSPLDCEDTPPSCSTSKELEHMSTPEKKIPTHISSSTEKDIFSDTDDESLSSKSKRVTRSSRKRSSQLPTNPSPNKRNKNNGGKEIEQLTGLSAESDVPKNIESLDVNEVKYIEAVGTVRKLRKLKHRGIDSTSREIRIYESPTRTHWDIGNTKLQISYRENVNQSDLQFVLVIYQHIDKNPRCKRDLMAEFAKACDVETPTPQIIEKKCKTNKNLKMRRLRF